MDGPTYLDIDERTNIPVEAFIDEYLSPQRPVIIKGGASEWRAFQTWSPEWLAKKYPDVQVPVAIGPRRSISEYRVMPIREYVDIMAKKRTEAQDHMYLRQFDLFKLIPDLLDDIPHPTYCPNDRTLIRNFWMGVNTLQPLHHDAHWAIIGTCNLFAQLYGSKRTILASPNETPFLYKQIGKEVDYHLSQVDIENPDFDRFPLVRQATLWKGQVDAGDLMLVPLNYWHFMEALGTSISVSFWWHPHPVSELASKVLKLAENPPAALKFIKEHAGVVKRKDIDELGGIDELREGLRQLPERLQKVVPMLFADDVRAAL